MNGRNKDGHAASKRYIRCDARVVRCWRVWPKMLHDGLTNVRMDNRSERLSTSDAETAASGSWSTPYLTVIASEFFGG